MASNFGRFSRRNSESKAHFRQHGHRREIMESVFLNRECFGKGFCVRSRHKTNHSKRRLPLPLAAKCPRNSSAKMERRLLGRFSRRKSESKRPHFRQHAATEGENYGVAFPS
ncbi:hypothetical protein JTE90_025134 [Oedothorax gibbosus]|uniref:Uncharacterized protein n=1 Tax=Oedothorax gibbosus TaxID=931172 RepID=A0AAV6UHF9_9ARAC|nr:hypothetical protein JTE90_025134 [Oedothorax gibbosus]